MGRGDGREKEGRRHFGVEGGWTEDISGSRQAENMRQGWDLALALDLSPIPWEAQYSSRSELDPLGLLH